MILGIDEVGRGPLAGPLVVGAVILPDFSENSRPEWISQLKDSKKLPAKKREELSAIILKEAHGTGLGWVEAREIDEVGISQALVLATKRAVKSVQKLHTPFSQIVIDGKVNFLKDTALSKYVTTVVKADDLIKEVSAASIIAKVARDKYMIEVGSKYPGYGFEKHMGYGTAFHRDAIVRLGPCPEHRKSFEPIKSMVGFGSEMSNDDLSDRGETVVCEYLVENGHKIISRNFKTKICEIDIVSLKGEKIYFTEVKTRKSMVRGGGLAAIDKKKLDKMKLAVEVFFKMRPGFKKFEPLLAAASVNGDFKLDEFVVLDA